MRGAGVLLAGALGACFDPSYDHPTCGAGGACPDGFACVTTTNVCAREGEDLVDANDLPLDAPTDAAIDGIPTDGIPTDGARCAEGVESPSFPGRCFFAVPVALPWANARNNCVNAGAVLADIRTAAEQTTVQNLLNNQTASDYWWIGLSDVASEGTFVWESGAAFSFTAWFVGEPNGGAASDCVVHAKSLTGWSDQACGTSYASVCVRTVP